MILKHQCYVRGPTLKDLHAQIQDSTRRSYLFLQKSLCENHHNFREAPLNPSMELYWSLKEDVKLLCQFDGSQLDPPLVSNMDTFLHDCTNSSLNSEDGEDNQPLKNFIDSSFTPLHFLIACQIFVVATINFLSMEILMEISVLIHLLHLCNQMKKLNT